MIEALVSIVLLAIGIVACLSTLSQMTRTESMMRDGERMRRLADQKLQELVATGDYAYVTSGDFSELGETRYSFSAGLEPTGVENLEVLVVTVTRNGSSDEAGIEASQLLFIPPVESGGAP